MRGVWAGSWGLAVATRGWELSKSAVLPPLPAEELPVVWAVEASRPLVSSVCAQWTLRKGRGPRGGISDQLELPSGEDFSFSPAWLRCPEGMLGDTWSRGPSQMGGAWCWLCPLPAWKGAEARASKPWGAPGPQPLPPPRSPGCQHCPLSLVCGSRLY